MNRKVVVMVSRDPTTMRRFASRVPPLTGDAPRGGGREVATGREELAAGREQAWNCHVVPIETTAAGPSLSCVICAVLVSFAHAAGGCSAEARAAR
jgi:hypothetical protein